jgi:hypothetical protein
MSSGGFARRVASVVPQALQSEDDLLFELQTTLAALADIECRREMERERLAQRLGSQAMIQRLWEERERRYRAEREPYMRKVERLQQRMRYLLTSEL